jgi:hypothetical protein
MSAQVLRPIRVEGNIAFLPLTRGYQAIVDVDDLPLVEGFNWYAKVHANHVYAARYDYSNRDKRHIMLHRFIMVCPQGLHVDHIDGDGLNNRRSNLRIVTNAQNSCNQKINKNNQSGFKGVHWAGDRKKWRACIRVNGRLNNIGCYSTPEDAYAAYCKASAELHGEYGRIA